LTDEVNRDTSHEQIVTLLVEKARVKQAVTDQSRRAFSAIRQALKQLAEDLRRQVSGKRPPLHIEYVIKGEAEVEFSLAGDTIVFLLHSNVFTFDQDHGIWKLSYVRDDESRAFCGQIFVYNFLSDSFRYSRSNDIGYLIARIFVNKEGHFFVEGKRQLGFLYNDLEKATLDDGLARKVVESCVLYCLDFDPYVPPYDKVGMVSVQEVLESTLQSKIATGKRLGFKFQADSDII
jgi:hypothetical protein